MPYELPIKYDSMFQCDHCNCYVMHQCTAYKDVEYRVCTKCGQRTTWKPEGHHLEETETKKDDARWQEDVDFKRNSERKYKPRNQR